MPLPPFHLHLDVLAVVLILSGGYVYADRVIRPLRGLPETPRRKWWSWQAGVFTILLSAGWPMHDLAEETLFTFHMVEHTIIGYLTPVLLLRGMPSWLGDATLGRPAVARWLRPLAHPVIGFFSFNLLIVFVHWPEAVAWQLSNEPAHLVIHAVLFFAGLLMFLPIHSPTAAIPKLPEPGQMLYLFLNTIIPIVPASFLAFSHDPLYPMYGDGPASWGLTFQEDQTIAGIFMKVVGGFYLLGSIAAIWFRWFSHEQEMDRLERELVDSPR